MNDAGQSGAPLEGEQALRERALQSIKKRRDFTTHLITYLVVNALLVGIWAMTSREFFWPVFPLLGWGIGLFFHGLDVYRGEPSEDEIQREMRRLR